MSIPVYYPLRVDMALKYHLADEHSLPLCGVALSGRDWALGAVAFIVDDVLCSRCATLRATVPSLQNPQEPERQKCLYIVRILGSNYYKIGITTNLHKRIKDLQQPNPLLLILVWHSEYSDPAFVSAMERHIHDMYRHKRMSRPGQREWFFLQDSEVRRIREIITGGLLHGRFETA